MPIKDQQLVFKKMSSTSRIFVILIIKQTEWVVKIQSALCKVRCKQNSRGLKISVVSRIANQKSTISIQKDEFYFKNVRNIDCKADGESCKNSVSLV